jgi:hypothetical protein
VVGDTESKGSKAMAMATRIAGKWTGTATKRAMMMAMRVAGKQQQYGNEEGNGNSDEGGG